MNQLALFAPEIEAAAAAFLEREPTGGEVGSKGTAVAELLSRSEHRLTVQAALNGQITVERMAAWLRERKRAIASYRPRFRYGHGHGAPAGSAVDPNAVHKRQQGR